ncbi:MAG: alpha/beta hydrolase-fold protein [Bacteroidota bacterium]
MKHLKIILLFIVMAVLSQGCKQKIKEQQDEIYSRHLQEHIKLTIISTPIPNDKKELNLLLLNGGQEIKKWRVKEIIDSLWKTKSIQPLVIVAIEPGNAIAEFGVAGIPYYKENGTKADKYAEFIDNELYAYAKKKAGVRKFKSVAIAGSDAAGLSAFDIAWDHADKIDKMGVFSGAFGVSDISKENPDYSDDKNRIIINKIRSSRKKPKLKYWFYGNDINENGSRYMDSISIDHTKDLIEIIKNKNISSPADIVYKQAFQKDHGFNDWSKALPDFLIWAFGK